MTLNLRTIKKEFISTYAPIPLVEQVIHTPVQVNGIFIPPVIENLATNYDALHDFPAVQTEKPTCP